MGKIFIIVRLTNPFLWLDCQTIHCHLELPVKFEFLWYRYTMAIEVRLLINLVGGVSCYVSLKDLLCFRRKMYGREEHD